MALLSYQHEDAGYPSEGAAATGADPALALVPGAHVRLAAARALAGGMKEGGQGPATATAATSPSSSSLTATEVIHKIQALFLASQPSSSSSTTSKGVGNKPSAPSSSSSISSLGAAVVNSKVPSRAVPLSR